MSRRTRGFTLIELLVAVAAGVLLATAIAAVFASTGTTVSTGKRISAFNRYAAQIEQQLREDFKAITRDGFLLIRQEVANQGPQANFTPVRVPLFPNQRDRDRRIRRTDEILFFQKGQFRTARSPLSPGINATGSEARVYIGHGAKFDEENLTGPAAAAVRYPAYDLGIESAGVNPRSQVVSRLGVQNSTLPLNQFASEWILLRHVTVMTPPQTASQELPGSSVFHITRSGNGFSPANAMLLRDGDRQIALQPAIPSIFRHLNYALRQPASDSFEMQSMRDRAPYPRLNAEPWMVQSTGLFDVATTTLAEVRQYVTSMHRGEPAPTIPTPILPSAFRSGDDIRDNPPQGRFPAVDPNSGNGRALIEGMHTWMRNALPADTQGDDSYTNLHGLRMRAEIAPPALQEVVSATSKPGYPPFSFSTGSLEAADRLNDQIAVSSSTFVPRCSEFMVEWSFNQIDRTNGEVIWYGSTDLIGSDANGVPNDVNITRYETNGDRSLFVNRRTGRVDADQTGNSHILDDFLIHGAPQSGADARKPVLCYFGYEDPTYQPQNSGDLPSLAWPWPKLIRVTITLVDATDPSVEQTYQFVFEVGEEG